MRILCDVNAAGRILLMDFFGLPDLLLAANWNSRVDGSPAIGSIMLPRGIWPELTRFAMFKQGALAVVETGGEELTSVFDQEILDRYVDLNERGIVEHRIYRNYKSGGPSVGSRNIHAFSGRTV
jgi:hypothetical protein